MEQLSNIVDQVQSEDLDTNAKLLEWSKKKFQTKVNEKILGEIALSQVELAKKLRRSKQYLRIYSHYTPNYVIHHFSHKRLAKGY